MLHKKLTDAQLLTIVEQHDEGVPWAEIADDLGITAESARHAYRKHHEALRAAGDPEVWQKAMVTAERSKRARSVAAREQRLMLGAMVDAEDLLDQFRGMIAELPKRKAPKVRAPRRVAGRTDMTIEVTLSDLHLGKKTATFDLTVAKARLKTFVDVTLREIERKQAHYNVEHIVIAMLGDLIENETMHGVESARGAEFGNAEQTMAAIELLLTEVLVPLHQTGIPLTIVGLTGNHDRDGERKTYHYPGRFSYTYVIYRTLRMFAEHLRLGDITWRIPDGVYTTLDIYGDTILYEHSDHVAGRVFDKKVLLNQIAKRSAQVNKVIKGIRVGHYHEPTCIDNGRVVGNGSLCGQDSYSDILGYTSIPSQTLTFYVRTANRSTAFYYSFPVYLGT